MGPVRCNFILYARKDHWFNRINGNPIESGTFQVAPMETPLNFFWALVGLVLLLLLGNRKDCFIVSSTLQFFLVILQMAQNLIMLALWNKAAVPGVLFQISPLHYARVNY